MLNKSKVLIVDSNAIYSSGVAFIIEKFIRDINTEVLDISDGIKEHFFKKRIDVLIIEDIFLLNNQYISKVCYDKKIKIIVTSNLNENQHCNYLQSLFNLNGYLPKLAPEEYLINTLTQVLEGIIVTNEEINQQLKATLCKNSLQSLKIDYNLSKKEVEVLFMVTEGKSNKQIALDLEITERTVEFHKTNLYKKTNSNSIADLVLLTIGSRLL